MHQAASKRAPVYDVMGGDTVKRTEEEETAYRSAEMEQEVRVGTAAGMRGFEGRALFNVVSCCAGEWDAQAGCD